MHTYKLLLLLGVAVLVSACTPSTPNTTGNTNTQTNTSTGQATSTTDGSSMAGVTYQVYTNKAVGYTIKIPTTWHWRHYIKPQIAEANPAIDDYLFVSPTRTITSFLTESPAEIVVEVSIRDINKFIDEDMQSTSASVSGESATRVSGIVNNQVFTNHQKIEYRFTHGGKTFRIAYLASAELDKNEQVFEEMVKSFQFGK